MGQPRHAHFGVPHGRRRISVERAEVALPVDQRIAQRELLRHANEGVVDGLLAMGVELTDGVADYTRTLLVGLVVVVAHLLHGEERTPVHGLETVAHVRQCAPNDDAHRVVEVRALNLFLDRDRYLVLDAVHVRFSLSY